MTTGELRVMATWAVEAPGPLLAGIHMSAIPALDYQRHLFRERDLRSVTANTRLDGHDLLALAGRLDLDVRTTSYPFTAAPQALADVDAGRVAGSAVLRVGGSR